MPNSWIKDLQRLFIWEPPKLFVLQERTEKCSCISCYTVWIFKYSKTCLKWAPLGPHSVHITVDGRFLGVSVGRGSTVFTHQLPPQEWGRPWKIGSHAPMSSFTAWGDEVVSPYDWLCNKLVVSNIDLLSTNTSYVIMSYSSCDIVHHVILLFMSYCSSCDIVRHVILWYIMFLQFYKQVTAIYVRILCTSASLHACTGAMMQLYTAIHHTVLLIMMSHIRDMRQSYKCWVQLFHGFSSLLLWLARILFECSQSGRVNRSSMVFEALYCECANYNTKQVGMHYILDKTITLQGHSE